MRSIFVIIIIVVFLQLDSIDSYRSKTKIPSIINTEASQWLSTLNIPRRWQQQYSIHRPSNEIHESLNQLQSLNDNGIRQFNTQSFDDIPMEVLYELSRQGRKWNRS